MSNYKSNDYEERYSEYADYLRQRQYETKMIPSEIIEGLGDKDIIEFYRIDGDTGLPVYSSADQYRAIAEFDSPERTFTILEERLSEFYFNQIIESAKYKEIELDEIELQSADGEIVIEKDLPQMLITVVCSWYYDWVESGFYFKVSHKKDPPWDVSGELMEFHLCKFHKINKCKKLKGWMEHCKTGEKESTYMSGCGFKYPTYLKTIIEMIESELLDSIVDSRSFEDDNKKDVFLEKYYEDVMNWTSQIYDTLSNMSVIQAYKIGQNLAISEE